MHEAVLGKVLQPGFFAQRAKGRMHSMQRKHLVHLVLVAALALRSIYCSDRLPRFFTHLQRLYTAEIREADRTEVAVA